MWRKQKVHAGFLKYKWFQQKDAQVHKGVLSYWWKINKPFHCLYTISRSSCIGVNVYFWTQAHSTECKHLVLGTISKVRTPIVLGYASYYTMYYKDIREFQILYLQDIC